MITWLIELFPTKRTRSHGSREPSVGISRNPDERASTHCAMSSVCGSAVK